jgi:hypothetical protein
MFGVRQFPPETCTPPRALYFRLKHVLSRARHPMLSRFPAILFAVAVGGALSAGLFVALSRQGSTRKLVAGYPLTYWVQCLDSGQDELRAAAQRNLPQFGVDAVAPLVARLDSELPEIASTSAATLAKMPPALTVPLLAAALRPGAVGSSAARRCAAIELLSPMPAVASAPAVDNIAAQLDDPDVCLTAAEYLIAHGADARALGVAARVLAGTERYCRLQSIRVLLTARPTRRPPPRLPRT